MPKGIPAPYNAELAEKICDTISTTDMGLEDVLKRFNKAISPKTWYKWQREVEECKEMISRARENQGILLFDRAHKVALNPLLGETVQTKKEGRRITETIRKKSDNVERAKLIVWTLMRRAAVLNRNLGERTTLAGDKENPLHVRVDREELLAKILDNRGNTPPK
jgi:hypothetical protein